MPRTRSKAVSLSLAAATALPLTYGALDRRACADPVLPTIPANTFNIASFGASTGATATVNFNAIQSAISACNSAGGGKIIVPAGTFVSLPGITIGNSTNLELDGALQAVPLAGYTNHSTNFLTLSGHDVELSGAGSLDGNATFSSSASDQEWWGSTTFGVPVQATRPRLLRINSSTRIYIKDVHIKNSPSFHVSFSGSNSEITIDDATVTAPSNAPNTDGIDVTGTNGLIKNTTVSVGDDNIVMKPQSTVCSNITISTCTFGSGHGVSIGGQTNAGMNGFFVSNCTFTGTTNGIHLKAGRGDGGLVQNLSFSNLTMTNVTSPFDVSSYYINGGDRPGPLDPTHVPSGGTLMEAPVLADLPKPFLANSTPQWQNITFSNIHVNGTSSNNFFYGTPEATIQNLVLSDVIYQNSPANGLNFVNDADVHLTGATAGPVQCAVVSSMELSGTPATPPTLTQSFSSSLAAQAAGTLLMEAQAGSFTNFNPGFDPASVNTVRISGELVLGKAAGTAGVYNLSGGSLVVGSVARIGDAGTGVFNQTGGTATIATLKLGGAAGGVGSWTISGGTASVTSTVIQNNSRLNFNGGNVSLGALQLITGGKALLSAGANKVLRSTTLSIDATSLIDLADNDMIIDYTGPVGTLVGDVRNYMRNGQLTSSSSTATTRLGYGDNAVLGKTTFVGQSVDSSSVLAKYTYAGDADLDGDADGVDIGTWATNFTGELGGEGTMVWTQGDWDYDGDVDGVDAGLWAQAFTGELGGGGLGEVVVDGPLSREAAGILRGLGIAVVPEPLMGACLAGLIVWRAGTGRQRRRR